MDYIAIGLFVVGVFLILAGIFLNQEKKILQKTSQLMEKNNSPAATAWSNAAAAPKPEATLAAPAASPLSHPPEPLVMAHQVPEVRHVPQARVEVSVSRQNPALFEKNSYLYLDHNRANVYTGREETFRMSDVGGIRRFGQGIFSYDGFTFRFAHQSGSENFGLDRLDHISFYPNCMALVQKNGLPTALVFLDETDSVRKVLETFRIENG